MPTKVQAKAAIDAAVVLIKADIDTILPIGVNIKDGGISFNPSHWTIILDAGGTMNNAEAIGAAITANLAIAGREYALERFRRESDGHRVVNILTQLATYRITNF